MAPDLGLARPKSDEPFTYWHVAASLDFRAGLGNDALRINVGGTANALGWFEEHAPPGSRFVQVSTAFVAPRQVTDVAEEPYPARQAGDYRNPYEYSKAKAEDVVFSAIAERGVAAQVVRPSSVVGSLASPFATTSGMYGVLRFLKVLARGRRRLTLRIEAHPEAAINLITIDECVRQMLAVALTPMEPACSNVFHVTTPTNCPVEWTAQAAGRHLGVDIVLMPGPISAPTRVESRLQKVMEFTNTYLGEPIRFDRSHFVHHQGPAVAAVDRPTHDALVCAYLDGAFR
jgi:nucleoside-diphosphate-sugar epimerase